MIGPNKGIIILNAQSVESMRIRKPIKLAEVTIMQLVITIKRNQLP